MSNTRSLNRDAVMSEYSAEIYKILIVPPRETVNGEVKQTAFRTAREKFLTKMGCNASQQVTFTGALIEARKFALRISNKNNTQLVTEAFCDQTGIPCDDATLTTFANAFLQAQLVSTPTVQESLAPATVTVPKTTTNAATSTTMLSGNSSTSSVLSVFKRTSLVSTTQKALEKNNPPIKLGVVRPLSSAASATPATMANLVTQSKKRKPEQESDLASAKAKAKIQTVDELLTELNAVESQIITNPISAEVEQKIKPLTRLTIFLNTQTATKQMKFRELQAEEAALTKLGDKMRTAIDEIKGVTPKL